MRLTQFSDYALRTLIYLGAHPDRAVPLTEVARSYGISYNHLVKIAGKLLELELVSATRGRSGGFRLAADPGSVRIGWLIRKTEDLNLVECFDPATDTCPIAPACSLKRVLAEAQHSFLTSLDRYTLADLVGQEEGRGRLVQLWNARQLRALG